MEGQLRKGAWTSEEDSILRECVDKYGEGKWHLVPSRTGLNRCRKSCRLRWLNYLKPDIKRGKFGIDEVDLLLRMHKLLGNRWSLIAGRLPGRTGNDVKNYWNTYLNKKQQSSCSTKIELGKNPTGSSVIKPQPRSFYNHNNGLSRVNGMPEVDIITCNKDKEKCEFVENAMDEDSMVWESLFEEIGGTKARGSASTTTNEASTSLVNSSLSMFDYDQLWSFFNEDNVGS